MDALPTPKRVKQGARPNKLSLPRDKALHNPAFGALQAYVQTCADFREHPPSSHRPVVVALSAGADSTALLLAAKTLWPHADVVRAVHIHHGLQAQADDFERCARDVCAGKDVPFVSLRIKVNIQTGESLEEQARDVRYRALIGQAHTWHASAVLLAHHADDQVESILLALTRGAGLAGLAGMAPRFERDGVVFHRPLLGVAAQALRVYLKDCQQSYVQDPMNVSMDLVRGKLRQAVLPPLQAHFPAYRTTFARSAQHIWQAQTILSEVAQEDMQSVGYPPRIRALQSLGPARLANVLRHLIRLQGLRAAQSRQVQELIRQIYACTTRGHQIQIKVGQGWAVRRGAYLHMLAAGDAISPKGQQSSDREDSSCPV